MMCGKCRKKYNCTKICDKVELVLSKLNHSLKSNYLVKFIDPKIIDNMRVDVLEEHIDPNPVNFYEIVTKSLHVLNKIEKYYIIRYYGLLGSEFISQCELAARRRVAQHTVYYHLRKARKKLRTEILRHMPKGIYNI